MKKPLLFACLAAAGLSVQAQSCEGGLYLNPQVIRGEGSSQTESALRELIEFIKPTGLSTAPVLNIRETQDVLTAIKKPAPPCWVYGNPVVGLASGYKPVAVNIDPIQSAILILGDVGKLKDGKPVELKSLPPEERAKVLARLKTTNCYGMKSGVTTALVQAENLCGTVVEVVPQQGLGQSYLPTKAAFHWQADRWVGLITRLQTAQGSTMKTHYGTDERIHMAQLVIVPASNPSWGYGLYAHPAAPADAVKKAAALLAGLKTPSPMLSKALDLGKDFDYGLVDDAALQAMKKALTASP
ncbi:hypothetical protein [uncultured Ramlibacter sp.]|uniref:hypothetical protein n=1 Tax=uncultured Ramlibacter sp. TaxID=260755 RepID=UPI00260CBF79|nr:hypothetical protein [uncultured Ramlibacter sp.]